MREKQPCAYFKDEITAYLNFNLTSLNNPHVSALLSVVITSKILFIFLDIFFKMVWLVKKGTF